MKADVLNGHCSRYEVQSKRLAALFERSLWPRWPILSAHTDCMLESHTASVPVHHQWHVYDSQPSQSAETWLRRLTQANYLKMRTAVVDKCGYHKPRSCVRDLRWNSTDTDGPLWPFFKQIYSQRVVARCDQSSYHLSIMIKAVIFFWLRFRLCRSRLSLCAEPNGCVVSSAVLGHSQCRNISKYGTQASS